MSRRTWRWVVILFGLPILLLGVMIGVGLFLPEHHAVSSRAVYGVSPDSLWAAVSTPERAALWRPDIERVERLPDRDGRSVWREIGPTGQLAYEQLEADAPHRLVIRMAEPDLPFSGLWIYEIASSGAGATLTLTERGDIYNPLYRFLARFLFGYHSTLDSYLIALGENFGEAVAPVRVPTGPE